MCSMVFTVLGKLNSLASIGAAHPDHSFHSKERSLSISASFPNGQLIRWRASCAGS